MVSVWQMIRQRRHRRLTEARNTRRPKDRLVCAWGWWARQARKQSETSRHSGSARVKGYAVWSGAGNRVLTWDQHRHAAIVLHIPV